MTIADDLASNGEFVCEICDVSDMPDPTKRVNGTSCADLGALSMGADIRQCQGLVVLSLGCGCGAPSAGCSLCTDGTRVVDRDKELVGLDGFTCGQAEVSAAADFQTLEESLRCDQWHSIGLDCGCPRPEGGCSICVNGDPPPELDRNIGVPCGLLNNVVAFQPIDERCERLQASAGVYCGCNNPSLFIGTTCRICGGDTLLPNAIAFAEDELGDDGSTEMTSCAIIESNADGTACSELQSRYFEACCEGIDPIQVAPSGGNAAGSPPGGGAGAPPDTPSAMSPVSPATSPSSTSVEGPAAGSTSNSETTGAPVSFTSGSKGLPVFLCFIPLLLWR